MRGCVLKENAFDDKNTASSWVLFNFYTVGAHHTSQMACHKWGGRALMTEGSIDFDKLEGF